MTASNVPAAFPGQEPRQLAIVSRMTDIRIGDDDEGISIRVFDDWKDGWVHAEVVVKSGAWSGRYAAEFHQTDFSQFAADLGALYSVLSGAATLSSMDGYLDLTLTGDGLGHISVAGAAWDRPAFGSHLEVSYEIDQTYLPAILASVESVLRQVSPSDRPRGRRSMRPGA
jgi:hypothetical protein